MNFEFFSFSHRGHARDGNEDTTLVRESTGLAAVFDGCGGHAAGEVASALAAHAVAAALASLPSVTVTGSGDATVIAHKQAVDRALRTANLAVHEGSRRPGHVGMATTAVVALAGPETLTVGHLGDSRCYLLRGPDLYQLTEDHTMYQALRTAGWTHEDAAAHPDAERLLGALGPDPDVEPTVRAVRVQEGDVALLCTDGVYRELTAREIARLLREDDPAGALLGACLLTPCRDNVSGVVVRIVH